MGLTPERLVEVRAAQLAALRADEDEPPLPRLGEPFEVPSDLRGDLGGERDGALPGLRLWLIRPQPAVIGLGERLLDVDLARRNGLGDLEDDGKTGLKLFRRSLPPFGPTKTKPVRPGAACRARCSRSSDTISAGKVTVRLPAWDLASVTRTSQRLRSKRSRVRPASSPSRSWAKVASSTRARCHGGSVSARAKTTGSGITARSSDSSLPAPSIRHGLRRMSSSSTAVP